MKTESMLISEAIYNVLQTIQFEGKESCFARYYSNGREQGYRIMNSEGTSVAFSQNRNSDEIVVYVESEEAKFFHSDEIVKSAQFIADSLKLTFSAN